MAHAFENAVMGENTIIEPNVTVGLRYHPAAGPARIGKNGILRAGTIIYGDVVIGDYFQSGHFTVIRAKVRMGKYCTVLNHSALEGVVRFGDGVRVMSNTYLPSRTWVGDNVFVGPGVTVLNDRYPARIDRAPRGPTIEDEVTIGGGVIIMAGVRIGTQSFVAAGALVNKDVPPRSLVMGIPGRISPLPADLDRANLRSITVQPTDLWHPRNSAENLPDWPADWPDRFEDAEARQA